MYYFIIAVVFFIFGFIVAATTKDNITIGRNNTITNTFTNIGDDEK